MNKTLAEMDLKELQAEYVRENAQFEKTGYYCRLAEIAYAIHKLKS